MENTSRNIILAKIKAGNKKALPVPFPKAEKSAKPEFLKPIKDSPDISFVLQFKQNGGQFLYCESYADFFLKFKTMSQENSWQYIHCWHPQLTQYLQAQDFRQCKIGRRLDLAHAGIMTCEALVAQTGSIVMTSALPAGRSLATTPKVCLIVASVDQVVNNLEEANALISQKYEQKPTMMSIISGPAHSRAVTLKRYNAGICPNKIVLFLIDTIELNFKI